VLAVALGLDESFGSAVSVLVFQQDGVLLSSCRFAKFVQVEIVPLKTRYRLRPVNCLGFPVTFVVAATFVIAFDILTLPFKSPITMLAARALVKKQEAVIVLTLMPELDET
jgi:hypothetical protein